MDDWAKQRLAELRAATPTRRKAKWVRRYVVFPDAWVAALRSCRTGKTFTLALHLLYEHWNNGGRPIRLANVALAAKDIGRKAKRTGLAHLEGVGLVHVERQSRKSPVVTCLQMEGCPRKGTRTWSAAGTV
jgi:hypothetical protein